MHARGNRMVSIPDTYLNKYTSWVNGWSGTHCFFDIFLRAPPGAASPLSSIAIRLTEHMGVFLALALIILGTLCLGGDVLLTL